MGSCIAPERSRRAVRTDGIGARQIHAQLMIAIHFAPLPQADTTCADIDEIMRLNLGVPKRELVVLRDIELVLHPVIAAPQHKDSRAMRRLDLAAIHKLHRAAHSDKGAVRSRSIHRDLRVVEMNCTAA